MTTDRRPLLPELGELAALGVAIAIAWWIGSAATDAWLARVAALGLRAPEADVVRGLAVRASLLFTAGVIVLGAGRVISRRHVRGEVAVPWLLPATVGACLLGLVLHHATVESAGGAAVLPTAAGFAQGFLIGCIVAAALLVAPIDLGQLASRARVPVAVAIFGIFAALAIAGSGPAGSGTRINLGPIQPIELAKPLVVVFLAGFLGARASKLRWQRRRVLGLRWPRLELLVPALGAVIAIFAGLYVIGDLGPVLILAFVFLGMFFVVSRATGFALVALALVGVLLAIVAWFPDLAGGGTVQTRLRMWTDPWTNGLSNGHQLGEGLWAIAAGGPTGQGLAHAAVPIVPAGKTDLALATLAEQLGALGLVGYQLLLAAILAGCLRVAAWSRTAERVLIAAGIGILILVQWAVIQAGTLGQLPLTGVVVPFVSAGRSSMIAFLAMIGIVVKLALDARPRAESTELVELHGAVRATTVATGVLLLVGVLAGVHAAIVARHRITAHGIVARLGDGTLLHRQNPRLVTLLGQLRRGTIADRHGAPLAVSDAPAARRYPLGDALGTLLGTAPARIQLPPWSLERLLDHRLRGYGELPDPPRRPGGGALPAPDLARFAPLLDLRGDERAAALRAIDADLAARSVALTLDARLQQRVAELAAAARTRGKRHAIAAVVLDVDTGHILARVQVPDLDPNSDWQRRVLAGAPADLRTFRGAYGAWPDKTGVQGMFQSGSVAKLFTALAAVRADAGAARFACVERDAQGPFFTRRGWHKPIHDHSSDRPHGDVDLVEAIAVSCNVYFGQLGLALGADPLRALRAIGVDVGYSTGSFDPGAPDSRQLASTAFGQGVMVLNVVQAARLVGAIAAGGTYRRCPPTMLLEAPCAETAIVDDPGALAPIVAGMRAVMTSGTGARLSPPAGVRVYGKTGTADVRGFAGEAPFGIAPRQLAAPHAWFVAFAEPTSIAERTAIAPGRLAVAVVVPRGGSGAAGAGPLAMEILAAARSLGYLGGAAAASP